MKYRVLFFFYIIFLIKVSAQTEKNSYLGVNVLQLPASTINVNYSIELNPYFTPILDVGYTFNYIKVKNSDWIGTLFTPRNNRDDGYYIDNQSGGYLKIGGFFNFRKESDKKNFFHLGLFITNSNMHVKGLYHAPWDSRPLNNGNIIDKTANFSGIAASMGYEFKITERLKSNIDFQFSFPISFSNEKYNQSFGYQKYISGMGYNNTNGNWFPMLIWNMKYRLF
jgi:hypothetical protein